MDLDFLNDIFLNEHTGYDNFVLNSKKLVGLMLSIKRKHYALFLKIQHKMYAVAR